MRRSIPSLALALLLAALPGRAVAKRADTPALETEQPSAPRSSAKAAVDRPPAEAPSRAEPKAKSRAASEPTKPETAKAPRDKAPGKGELAKAPTAKAAPAKPETTKKAGKLEKSARAKKVEAPCFAPEVHVVRNRAGELEHRQLNLTFCDGSPNPSAVDSISVLARPRNVERPLMPEIKAYQRRALDRGPAHKRRKAEYLSELVMRVHPDLAVRLQKIAQRFPGKTIEIISGHRPDARSTSRHHHGRALDVHVEGVSREQLRDFLRTLDQTGVGYYPNGYFVHVDVRDDRGYWIDRSGPGEAADYGQWPPRKEEIERDSARVIERAVAELDGLARPLSDEPSRPEEETRADAAPREETQVMHEDQELTRDEVERIKAEALRALAELE
jgi:hypothetical protein